MSVLEGLNSAFPGQEEEKEPPLPARQHLEQAHDTSTYRHILKKKELIFSPSPDARPDFVLHGTRQEQDIPSYDPLNDRFLRAHFKKKAFQSSRVNSLDLHL